LSKTFKEKKQGLLLSGINYLTLKKGVEKMQKEYVKILIHKKRDKMSEVLTYGYRSKVPGLAITRDIDKGYKTFSITHIKSGYGFLLSRFTSIKKAQKIIKMFFEKCNWNQEPDQIIKDPVILTQYQAAQKFLTDNNF